MTVIIDTATSSVGKIGYKNLFESSGVTVTASTEATDYAKENAYDGFGYDWWKPTTTGDSWIRASLTSSKVANYMAVWAHNLGDTNSFVKPQYSTNGGSSWSDAADPQSPGTNRTLFFTFDDILAKDWRLLVTNPTSIAVIGGIMIGEILNLPKKMEVGFMPPTLVPIVKLKTTLSETGSFIGGRKISEGMEGSFSLTSIDPVWVQSEWSQFITHAQTPKVFVLAWDITNHSSQIVLCWITKQMQKPAYSSPLYMDIMLSFKGII